MNSVVNVGGAGLSFGVLAAGLLLAYGVWQGRRDLGERAAWGILGTTVLTGVPPVLFVLWPLGLRLGVVVGLLLPALLTLLAFVPLYIAANWLGVIREATERAGQN